MANPPLEAVIEALLMSASEPITLKALHDLLGEDYPVDQVGLLATLRRMQAVVDLNRGVELVEVASGFRYQSKSSMKRWLAKMLQDKPISQSRVLMEVAAIIAYNQPVTRGDIEQMRGVSTQNSVVRQLIDLGWVRIVGHKDIPGKPELLGTTKGFLDYFNLNSLADLPEFQAEKAFES